MSESQPETIDSRDDRERYNHDCDSLNEQVTSYRLRVGLLLEVVAFSVAIGIVLIATHFSSYSVSNVSVPYIVLSAFLFTALRLLLRETVLKPMTHRYRQSLIQKMIEKRGI